MEQLRHSRWTIGDGAPANILAIAQTQDGFLWLGSATGLYRFDGIRFERIDPVQRDPARSLQVTALLCARNGDLWVGYDYGGVAVYRNGVLRGANDQVPKGAVTSIVQTDDGKIWFSSRSTLGPFLRYIDHGIWRWMRPGVDIPQKMIQSVAGQNRGGLILISGEGADQLSISPFKSSLLVKKLGPFPVILQDRSGANWVADDQGLRRLDGTGERLPLPSVAQVYALRMMAFDRRGDLWITGQKGGVMRVDVATLTQLSKGEKPTGSPQIFKDISGGASSSAFEDREGNIWLGSDGGLDRYATADVNLVPGFPTVLTGFHHLRPAHRIVFGGQGGIYELSGPLTGARPYIALPKVVENFCVDDAGNMLAFTNEKIISMTPSTRSIIDLKRPDGLGLKSCASDGNGGFLASSSDLYHIKGNQFSLVTGEVGQMNHAMLMRSFKPGDILSYRAFDKLRFLHNGKVQVLWQGRDIPVGFIKTIVQDGKGLLIGGEHGLARYDGRSFQVLNDQDHPFFANVTGILPIADGSTWVISSQGIVRIATSDLDTAFKKPSLALSGFMVGHDQGLRSRSNGYDMEDIVQDERGLLWFATNRGLAWLDPQRLLRNVLAPPVVVRSVTANGQAVPLNGQPLRLPGGTQHVSFDYTALSLTDAIANQFRYRLTGIDSDWVIAGSRRQADYNSLHPGTYRFQVIAANGDGIWNRTGVTLDFTIEPYFYQTWWFKAGLIVVVGIVLAVLGRWRLRETAELTRNRIEAQVEERERIARELHDTLLQGVQGLMMRFQAVAETMVQRSQTREMMEGALERGDDILVESREKVRNLRENSAANDLAEGLKVMIGDRAAGLTISGKPRPVCGPVVSEILAIAGEALANAYRHADAEHISVTLLHGFWALKLEVADDGCGIDPEILKRGEREGHYGLIGMRERAKQLRGRLTIRSAVMQGTRVQLRIPGRIAYSRPWM